MIQRLLTFLLLIFFAVLGWKLTAQGQPVQVLKEIRVAADPQGVILGRAELAQRPDPGRAAEQDHLLVKKTDASGWELANVAQQKKVDAPTTRYRTRYLKRWRLQTGDRMILGNTVIGVIAIDKDRLELATEDGRRVIWQGGRLTFPKTTLDQSTGGGKTGYWVDCPNEGNAWWKRYLYGVRDIDLWLFSLGGLVNCKTRWRLSDVASQAAVVHWYGGEFWLAPGRGDVEVRMARAGSDEFKSFRELTLPLTGEDGIVQSVVIGRTQYRLQPTPDSFRLIPIGGSDVWYDGETLPSVRDPSHVLRTFEIRSWLGGGAALVVWLFSQWPWAVLALGLTLILVLGLLWRQRRLPRELAIKSRWHWLTWVPALFFGVLTVALWRSPGDVDSGILLSLCGLVWTWASLLLLVTGRLQGLSGGLWCCVVGLSGFGTLTLVQLAAGGNSTRWLLFADKYLLLMTLAGCLLLPLIVVSGVTLRWFFMALITAEGAFWRWLRWVPPLLLALLLLVQPFAGSERGLAGIQPVEAAKFMLVIMTAFVGLRLAELRRTQGREFRTAPLRFIIATLGTTGLFFIFATAMMVAVADLSPVLLLCLLGLPFIWRMAPHPASLPSLAQRWLRGGVVLLVAGGIGVMAWWYQHPSGIPHWLPQQERIQVWADPLAHPHSGSQVLQAMAYAAAGHWLPTSWFGLNGAIMNLPAVQDDFIATFFIARFGKLAALVLLALQLSFVGLLFSLSWRIERWGARGDYRERMTGATLSLAIFGLAWMFAGHWLVSWGNVLGLLPVMGQPMTWLSAATSHMAFFALPGLVLALVTTWLVEDER